MENTINFERLLRRQTPKQMERTEEMNGLIATLLADTQVKSFDEYVHMLELLDSINDEMQKHPETLRLIAGLAELTYQSYVACREKMLKEHLRIVQELEYSSRYQMEYDDYKNLLNDTEDEIVF